MFPSIFTEFHRHKRINDNLSLKIRKYGKHWPFSELFNVSIAEKYGIKEFFLFSFKNYC